MPQKAFSLHLKIYKTIFPSDANIKDLPHGVFILYTGKVREIMAAKKTQ
jgi:hypothetical protein